MDENSRDSSAAQTGTAGAPASSAPDSCAPATPAPAIVTAGLLVIGDEILSGRTKDRNIGHIAEFLTAIGVDLKEARVVADARAAIIEALDALRRRYDYAFTTGGIGPTHDDITAECVAAAFGVPLEVHPRAVEALRARLGAAALNEARLRMARVPRGAALIETRASAAPGFWIDNVIVMAGVPSIMQAMLAEVAPRLRAGAKLISATVRADLREGDIGAELAAVAAAHPGATIGSYPFMDEAGRPNTNVVARARDPETLAAATAAIERMLEGVRATLARPPAERPPPPPFPSAGRSP